MIDGDEINLRYKGCNEEEEMEAKWVDRVQAVNVFLVYVFKK